MSIPTEPAGDGPLALAAGAMLAMAAGAVDATSLAATGRFTAHMSGTTSAAIRAGLHEHADLLSLGAATIISFIAGVALSGILLAAHESRATATRMRWMLVVEMLLIAIAGIWPTGATPGTVTTSTPMSAIPLPIFILFLAAAMGFQNNLSQRAWFPVSEPRT